MAQTSTPLVHPRACGEHLFPEGHESHARGSSPRLRGTRGCDQHDRAERRFIPAPAGNTGPLPVLHVHPAVHPRACGEHAAQDTQIRGGSGSSPRLRGTRQARQADDGPRRFIPAPAGNTPSHCHLPEAGPVHPRACGEHIGDGDGLVLTDGSSPRLRGTQPLRSLLLGHPRFIPAPAGNTLASKWLIAQRNHDVKELYRRCGFVLGRPMPSSRRRASSRREGRRPPV